GVVSFVANNVYGVANTGFSVGESVDVNYANNSSKGVTATISAIDNATGTLTMFSNRDNTLKARFVYTSGDFNANDILIGISSNTMATIGSLEPLKYSVVDFEPAFLDFAKTTCEFQMLTTS